MGSWLARLFTNVPDYKYLLLTDQRVILMKAGRKWSLFRNWRPLPENQGVQEIELDNVEKIIITQSILTPLRGIYGCSIACKEKSKVPGMKKEILLMVHRKVKGFPEGQQRGFWERFRERGQGGRALVEGAAGAGK